MRFGIAGWFREATLGAPDDFLDMFALADRLGFDEAWLNEFHFERENHPFPNTLLLAAAGFARTERLRIGLSVAVLPIYHPLLLAEALAQLDYQSQGRLDVGIGRGTTPATLAALEIDPTDTRGRFAEAYEIMIAAWIQDRASYHGAHWTFDGVTVGPPPIQQPHPPIYVGGTTRETVQFAVEHDLPLILASETERETIAAYRDLLAERGMAMDLSDAVFSRYLCVAPTHAEAERLVDRVVHELNSQKRRLDPAAPPAYEPTMFRQRDCIFGTPEECIAQIRALAETWGARHLRCFFNKAGTVDRETERAMTELFAREVAPACRDVAIARAHV